LAFVVSALFIINFTPEVENSKFREIGI
jgi:hypothetical protein